MVLLTSCTEVATTLCNVRTHTAPQRPSVRVSYSYSSSLEHLPSTPGQSSWLSTSHVYLPTTAACRSARGRAGKGVHGRRKPSSQAQGGQPWAKQMGL